MYLFLFKERKEKERGDYTSKAMLLTLSHWFINIINVCIFLNKIRTHLQSILCLSLHQVDQFWSHLVRSHKSSLLCIITFKSGISYIYIYIFIADKCCGNSSRLPVQYVTSHNVKTNHGRQLVLQNEMLHSSKFWKCRNLELIWQAKKMISYSVHELFNWTIMTTGIDIMRSARLFH